MTGKVLIVDDLATSRIVLKARLGSAFYSVLQAADGKTGLALAREAAPDVVLLDAGLPDMDGPEFCRRLRMDPETAALPVVILGLDGDPEARLAALRAGADDYLAHPLNEALLMARLRNLIRSSEVAAELQSRDETCRDLGFSEPPAAAIDTLGPIGLVAEIPGEGVIWRSALTAHLPGKIALLSRCDVLAEAGGVGACRPEAYLLIAASTEARAPGSSAHVLDLMSELRSRAATRHAAILVALPAGDPATAAMALDLGAGDVVTGPLSPPEISLRLGRLIRTKRRLDRLRAAVNKSLRLAMIDPLTGLYNRRYALPHLARITERARLGGKRFAVMVLDLDRFKLVNDTWGHAAGDAVLIEVAARLGRNLREGDLLARIGGEEFMVVLPDADPGTARRLAERLCRLVEAGPVALPGGGQAQITMSIGLALCDPADAPTAGPLDFLERADRALLAAKTEGRNQVTVGRPAA